LLEDVANPSRRIGLRFGQLDIALDDSQEIVEVVRDAAGQHRKRFELARLQELFFDLLALRDFGAELSGGLVELGGTLLDPKFEFAIEGLGLAVGSLQIENELPILQP